MKLGGAEACCNIKCDVAWNMRYVVMWNVVQWWCDVEWCGVEWCDVKGGVM